MRVVSLATVLVLAIVVIAGSEVRTGLWERLSGFAPDSGTKEAEAFDDVVRYVGVLADGERTPIAAMATEVGHWRLANRVGEIITAAGRGELANALRTLAPETDGKPEKFHVHLDPDSLFRRADLLEGLLETGRQSVVIDGRALQIRTSRDGRVARYDLQVAPGLYVEAADRVLFKEVTRQLRRPLHRSTVGVVALEPGGNSVLGRSSRVESGTRQVRHDAIDPGQLARRLQGQSGEIVLLTGRLSGNGLAYKSAGGGEGRIGLADLWHAAAQADANLIVLATSSPRQPGSRNWLWQRMGLSNADRALKAPSLGAFLHVLAGEQTDLTVKGRRLDEDRFQLEVVLGSGSGPAPRTSIAETLKGTWSDIVSETAGSLKILGMRASLTHSNRQAELDRRLLPNIPSAIQFGYLALVAMGLLGLPVLRAWWRRIWPDETTPGDRSLIARSLAHATRSALFAGLFLPMAAVPALLVRMARWFAGPSRGQDAIRRGDLSLG